MDQDAVDPALGTCTLRPAVRAEVPAAWWALLGVSPPECTAVVTSWWPSGVLTGFPPQPEPGTELVDVRPVVDHRGRPQLAYVHRYRTGVLGVMLHPDTRPGQAYSWWDELWLVELASHTAGCISSGTRWDEPPPAPVETTYVELRARLDALPETRRVELQPPPDGA